LSEGRSEARGRRLTAQELRRRIAELRKPILEPKPVPRPSFWTRHDRMFHGKGVVHYAVLDTGGCRWAADSGGCAMCGFIADTCMREVSPAEIVQQVEQIVLHIERSKGPFGLRIFTSGSFLDDREIPADVRQEVLRKLGAVEGLAELTVESRPEHVDSGTVSELREHLAGVEIEVAIGLESSSDRVRDECIGKGFTFREFQRACECIKSEGARSKAYVLLKPPFLSEFDSWYDAVQTIKDVAGMVDSVSVNACNVQKGTLVEELFKANEYRPPWIWTVMEVLREAKRTMPGGSNVICDTVAFGTTRGPHNCRRCDRKATAMVRLFSLAQDARALEGLECPCRAEWAKIYNYHF